MTSKRMAQFFCVECQQFMGEAEKLIHSDSKPHHHIIDKDRISDD